MTQLNLGGVPVTAAKYYNFEDEVVTPHDDFIIPHDKKTTIISGEQCVIQRACTKQEYDAYNNGEDVEQVWSTQAKGPREWRSFLCMDGHELNYECKIECQGLEPEPENQGGLLWKAFNVATGYEDAKEVVQDPWNHKLELVWLGFEIYSGLRLLGASRRARRGMRANDLRSDGKNIPEVKPHPTTGAESKVRKVKKRKDPESILHKAQVSSQKHYVYPGKDRFHNGTIVERVADQWVERASKLFITPSQPMYRRRGQVIETLEAGRRIEIKPEDLFYFEVETRGTLELIQDLVRRTLRDSENNHIHRLGDYADSVQVTIPRKFLELTFH